jgi:hypothetical protein
MQIHSGNPVVHVGEPRVNQADADHPFVVLPLGPHVMFIEDEAEADELIAALQLSKAMLAEAKSRNLTGVA